MNEKILSAITDSVILDILYKCFPAEAIMIEGYEIRDVHGMIVVSLSRGWGFKA